MWAFFPSVGGLGVPLSVGGFWGVHQHLWCPYAHSCTFFIVHYVSCFYYGYDYSSSSYGGIFWPVIGLISDSGSFCHRVSSKLGSAWSGSTTTLDAKRLWRCYWLSFCATAANSIFIASSGLFQLCYGFSTGRFLFQSWASHCFVYYMFGVHSGVCFLLSGAKLDAIFTYGGSTIRVCTLATLWSLPMAGICATWHWSMLGMHQVAAPSATLGRGKPSATHSAVPQPYGGAYSLGGSVESHSIPLPSLHDGEGSSFPGLVPSDDEVHSESVMGIKPGDSSVVIGYQVDKFTCTWSAEQFIAHSHIYPGFTGKVSSLTHFPLGPWCEDYAFLDQAVADFEQGLDSILTDSQETLELDTSLEEPDALTSSISSGFLHLVSTLSDNSKLQLAPSIHNPKLWCQAKTLFVPVSLATKMSTSKLIHYFSSHPAAFGFRASTPPDNISLNSANRKADQSLSDFRLVWVPLHMLLLTQNNLFLIFRLPWLILIPHCQRLREMLYLCLKCVNYFSRFVSFWTMLFPSELEIQHIF